MEKDIKLGSMGDLDLSFAAGKAALKLSAQAVVDAAGFNIDASVMASMDSAVLIDKLFAAIEKASPPGIVLIEESVKQIIKEAVAKL